MTRTEFTKFMQVVFDKKIAVLYTEGNREYSTAKEAFENFNNLAAETGQSRFLCLWILFLKHKDGVSAWIKGHRSQREAVQGRIYDMIVYLFLLLGMIEEENDEKRNIVVSSRSESGSPTGGVSGGGPAHRPGSIVDVTKDGGAGVSAVQAQSS